MYWAYLDFHVWVIWAFFFIIIFRIGWRVSVFYVWEFLLGNCQFAVIMLFYYEAVYISNGTIMCGFWATC